MLRPALLMQYSGRFTLAAYALMLETLTIVPRVIV
jgi:hypothetical protein